MNQQDIVWVKVPFSNLEEEKIRPALIVSNTEYNAKNLDVIICAITSNLEQRLYSVFLSQKNLSDGKLSINSKIKADKIMQVEKSRIIGQFAILNDETFDLVVKEIEKLISRSK